MVWIGTRTCCFILSAVMGIIGTVVDTVSGNVFYNVTCTSDTMTVVLNLASTAPQPFVYLQNLKGFPGCQPEIKLGYLLFHLNLNSTGHCGVSKMLNKETGNSIFYHRVILEVPGKDIELLFVQCVIPGDFNMDFVRLDWQRESLPVQNFTKEENSNLYVDYKPADGNSLNVTHSDIVPYLQMSIRDRGTRVDTSTIINPGSLLDLLIYMEKDAADVYGLSLRYLTLTDDTKSQEEVIVMNGCSVDPFVIELFRVEDGVLKSQFRAFKFQSSEFVIFLATVNVCLHRCVETGCYGKVDNYGRRKREIPRYLPHYKNEIYEVEISAYLRLKTDVPGDIIREESTNETLEALYESVDDYSDVEISGASYPRAVAATLYLSLIVLFRYYTVS